MEMQCYSIASVPFAATYIRCHDKVLVSLPCLLIVNHTDHRFGPYKKASAY